MTSKGTGVGSWRPGVLISAGPPDIPCSWANYFLFQPQFFHLYRKEFELDQGWWSRWNSRMASQDSQPPAYMPCNPTPPPQVQVGSMYVRDLTPISKLSSKGKVKEFLKMLLRSQISWFFSLSKGRLSDLIQIKVLRKGDWVFLEKIFLHTQKW